MPTISKKTLIDRWRDRSGPYGSLLNSIEALLNEPSLATLRQQLPTFDGRLDLRGLDLSDLQWGNRLSFTGSYDGVDFSYSTFESGVCFERSSFIDCVFDHAKIVHAQFWGSRFERCRFAKTVIDTAFGDPKERSPENAKKKGRIAHYVDNGGYDYERMESCEFIQAKFKKYSNFAAINIGCLFDRCEIRSGYIRGAFENCKFIGKLHDNIFVGYQAGDEPFGPNTLMNTMRGVDFSECELTFMAFYQACDLSGIVPPDPTSHCIYPTTLAFAREVERIGLERGMDNRYPVGTHPSFRSSLADLYRMCAAQIDEVIRLDPINETLYREHMPHDREREAKAGRTLCGMITPRDFVKHEDYQRELFEIFAAAQQQLTHHDSA
jgi:hypothetical protein